MMLLDVGSTPPLPASVLDSTVARGGKRIDPRPGPDLCWPGLSLGASSNDDEDDKWLCCLVARNPVSFSIDICTTLPIENISLS